MKNKLCFSQIVFRRQIIGFRSFATIVLYIIVFFKTVNRIILIVLNVFIINIPWIYIAFKIWVDQRTCRCILLWLDIEMHSIVKLLHYRKKNKRTKISTNKFCEFRHLFFLQAVQIFYSHLQKTVSCKQ